ncbi:MAG: ABC transporter substrate-binding protein [Brasilonema octagenarum HA4186-MV1]|jgi:ABC-type branched-subunit amino acid transport system substrate-binding protein|nr:ABC transporter substrate-binding protein [Brasilonema octagenarum HA4186-MV1]
MITNLITRRNPYIIGRPIDEQELLFGREKIFQFIENNLKQGVKVLFLYGQRRIGLSSIIRNVSKYVASEEFVFVTFDLQEYSREPLSSFLHNLIIDIITDLKIDIHNITLPSASELETQPEIFCREFLPQVYEALKGKKLVLLLNKADTLDSENNILLGNVCRHLNFFIQEQDNLSLILFFREKLADKSYLLNLFQNAPYQEVGLLDENSAKQLITKPAEGVLKYDDDAVIAILQLSAGHPYFTQTICFTLFVQARIENNWKVTRADVEASIDKAMESAEAGLAWLWDGISIPEQVVLSSVAQAQRIAFEKQQPFPEEPLTLLQEHGVIETDDLIHSEIKLVKNDFLDETQRKVKIELFRRWLLLQHPLHKQIFELEKLEEEKSQILHEAASKLHQEGKNHDAIELYEQVLQVNPNHFSTLSPLAKAYLETENFDKALQLYERAYKVDPIRHQEAYLRALEIYGNHLSTQGNFDLAKQQFEKVLEIEPGRIVTQQRWREIHLTYKTKRTSLKAIATALGIFTITCLSLYRWTIYCSASPQNSNNLLCFAGIVQQNNITNNISRGDRTLFPTIRNPYRDKGIKAFKQGNYQQAVNYFAQAVQYNRNDPEVLIYYNNALARQKGSPFTIAVVVPVQNKRDITKEILRGVALSQNQYNNLKDRLNNHSLEIAIANDGNNPEQAKQVAQQLVDDKSVLAVIGHYSSEATKAGLDEYQKASEPLAVISPTSLSTFLEGKIFFRTVPSNVKVSQQLAGYIWNQLNLKKVVVFYNHDSSFSNNLKDEFTNKFKQLGGQVVSNIDLTEQKLDVDQKLNESVSQQYQAQAALLLSDVQYNSMALEIIRTKANSKNPKVQSLQLLGNSTLYNDRILREGGNAIEGLIVSVPWFREAPQSQNFAQKAAQQWGGQISWRTATSYDATQALIQALSSNPSRATVLQRLRQVNLSPQETSGNTIQFTPQGEIQIQPLLLKIKDGKFKILGQ